MAFLQAFLAVGGIGNGIFLDSSYGSVPKLLALVYGLAALASAIGLWTVRPWALQSTIILSMATLIRIFNLQFGANESQSIPLSVFVPYVLVVGFLLVLMLYYVKKELSRSLTNSLVSEGLIPNPNSKQSVSVVRSVLYSCILFLIVSFINFVITIVFISKDLVTGAIFNALLNLLPIYLLAKYFIAPLKSKTIYIAFFIGSIIASVILVIPYGDYVWDFIFDLLRHHFN